MANTIITKNSSTASAVPSAGSLTQGELAVNVTDKKLYTKDSGGSVVEITPTAIQGTTTASVPTSALGSGTANSSTVLLGDRTWGTLSGGVSSLNGQTGAITNTSLYAIGSYVMGRDLSPSTNYSANNTLGGSSLYNVGAAGKRNYDNTWKRWDGQAFDAPALPSTVGTGTWRCTTPTHGGGGGYPVGGSGLWVRIS